MTIAERMLKYYERIPQRLLDYDAMINTIKDAKEELTSVEGVNFINDLNLGKVSIMRVKAIVDEVLQYWHPVDKMYLEYKYFKTCTHKEMERVGVTVGNRTYYRKQNKILEEFTTQLYEQYDEDWLYIQFNHIVPKYD